MKNVCNWPRIALIGSIASILTLLSAILYGYLCLIGVLFEGSLWRGAMWICLIAGVLAVCSLVFAGIGMKQKVVRSVVAVVLSALSLLAAGTLFGVCREGMEMRPLFLKHESEPGWIIVASEGCCLDFHQVSVDVQRADGKCCRLIAAPFVSYGDMRGKRLRTTISASDELVIRFRPDYGGNTYESTTEAEVHVPLASADKLVDDNGILIFLTCSDRFVSVISGFWKVGYQLDDEGLWKEWTP